MPRRLGFLVLSASLIGVIAGFVGVGFVRTTAALLNLVLVHRVSWTFPRLANLHPSPILLPVAAAGGLIVGVVAMWAPLIRGHGIPEAMEAVLVRRSRISWRTAMAKPLATLLSIGTGAPFGAEGPIIMTGGAVGSLIGQALRVSPAERKVLLAAGSAAGMAAIFGTPIGAVVIAIELLLFEFSTRALLPIIAASVFADGVHRLFLGAGALFPVTALHYPGLWGLPLYLLLGLFAGGLGLLITEGMYRAEDVFERMPGPTWSRPIVGSLGFAAIGLLVPRSLGVGYDVIGAAIAGKLALATMGAVFGAKLMSWWVAMGSGTSGSSLAPVLLIGAAGSGAFGAILHSALPAAAVAPAPFALVGMAATFAAAAGAPFTAITFTFELTRDFNILLPLMFATVVADLVARAASTDTLMTRKLTRRGIRVSTSYRVDLPAVTPVADVMTRDVATVRPDARVPEVRRLFEASKQDALVLVDGDRCVGIFTHADLLRHRTNDRTSVREIATSEVITVQPGDTVFAAVQVLLGEGVRQVPVVDGQALVGLFTRRDALRITELEIARERAEAGWVSGLLRWRRGEPPKRAHGEPDDAEVGA